MSDKVRMKTALEGAVSPAMLLPMNSHWDRNNLWAFTKYYYYRWGLVPLLHLQAFQSPLPETISAVSKLSEYPGV